MLRSHFQFTQSMKDRVPGNARKNGGEVKQQDSTTVIVAEQMFVRLKMNIHDVVFNPAPLHEAALFKGTKMFKMLL